MQEKKNRATSFVAILGIVICIIFLMLPDKLSEKDEEKSSLNNYTIYVNELTDESKEELTNVGFKQEDDSSAEIDSFINSSVYSSIKDVDGATITIDSVNKKIVIEHKDAEILQKVYDKIVNEFTNNKSKYYQMLNQVSYISIDEIENIEIKDDKIVIDLSHVDKVDSRFINMPYEKNENITEGLVLKNYNGINSGIGVVFKPEMVYAQGVSELGLEALNKISELDDVIWNDNENTGIYQLIDFKNVLTPAAKHSEKNIQELVIEKLPQNEINNEISIYIREEALSFESVIIELFESMGYDVKVVDDEIACDVIVDYTWFYFENIQSSLDVDLNEAIREFCLIEKEPETIRALFKSSWVVEKAALVNKNEGQNKTGRASIVIINENDMAQNIDKELLDKSVGFVEDKEEDIIELYNTFKAINEDVVSYFRIRNSNMNFPIVQQHTVCSQHNVVDNCYYLYRDIYKRSAVNTSAIQFMEANNHVGKTIKEFDQNTVIFGHTWTNNEKNGKLARIGDPNDKQFDQLLSYIDMNWLNEHRVLEYTTGTERTYWVPQFIAYTDCSRTNYPDGFNYGKRTLNTDDLKLLYDRSVIVNSDDVDADTDKFLLLSTCNYKYGNRYYNRFVVVFKNIEADNYYESLEKAENMQYLSKDNIVNW